MSAWTASQYKLRKEILGIQGNKCAICGQRVISHVGSTLDHVWPISKGGYDGVGNVVCAHKSCNNEKADRRPYPCEIIWLVSVCEKLGSDIRMRPELPWSIA